MPEIVDETSTEHHDVRYTCDERREHATRWLPTIVERTRSALAESEIRQDVFFVVPNSGNAVVLFGTADDPEDAVWDRISGIVVGIVQDVLQMQHAYSRNLASALAHSTSH